MRPARGEDRYLRAACAAAIAAAVGAEDDKRAPLLRPPSVVLPLEFFRKAESDADGIRRARRRARSPEKQKPLFETRYTLHGARLMATIMMHQLLFSRIIVFFFRF